MSTVYACKGKDGRYRVLATAIPAGTSREHGKIVVYQDIDDGECYYRTEADFKDRMEQVKP